MPHNFQLSYATIGVPVAVERRIRVAVDSHNAALPSVKCTELYQRHIYRSLSYVF